MRGHEVDDRRRRIKDRALAISMASLPVRDLGHVAWKAA